MQLKCFLAKAEEMNLVTIFDDNTISIKPNDGCK